MKGNANDSTESPNLKNYLRSSALPPCLSHDLLLYFLLSVIIFFLEKMYFKKIQKRGERERKWVREMWMRWLFVCNSLYIY